jgi:hypothetical protein
MEGREVAIGADGLCEDAVEGVEEWELFGSWRSCGGEAFCPLQDESGGLLIGENHVDLILRLQPCSV